MVEPLEKTVILPDAQQQVTHKATEGGPANTCMLAAHAVLTEGLRLQCCLCLTVDVGLTQSCVCGDASKSWMAHGQL